MSNRQTLLLKLRPNSATALHSAERQAMLRPLAGTGNTDGRGLGAVTGPRWFVAELDGDTPTPWDLAHHRVADRLGLRPSDVVFAEPDQVSTIYQGVEAPDGVLSEENMLALAGKHCKPLPQKSKGGTALGPDGVFAWHLGEDFSQLEKARQAVEFTDPGRTRIAHLDTGYSPEHVSVRNLRIESELERDFLDDDGTAIDPNRKSILDEAGHGTGTLAILAGGEVPDQGIVLGGAPDASVVPIRVSRSVVLLRTRALAEAVLHAVDVGCDVLSLSMGGWPSRAWAEAVDSAYLRGLVLCTAAGNHFGELPPRRMVYPARYPRVIGVCGVMADQRPYDGLKGLTMEGSVGPRSAMRTALAAYTPNIPWAKIGCPEVFDLDGAGTSSATPQVAAAAALWLEKYKAGLPRDWRRVEAVRHALFSTADPRDDPKRFGNGTLRAFDALAIQPDLRREQSKRSSNSFAFLRLLTGLGFDAPTPRETMFNQEIAQRWLVNPALQELVPDPDAEAVEVTVEARRRFMEALIEDEDASRVLRRHLEARYPLAGGGRSRRGRTVSELQPPTVPTPTRRKLRVFAIDPSLATRHATSGVDQVTLAVPWEELEPGPRGEYLEIVDIRPSGATMEGVDLDDPRLLAQDGWEPSEGNPQFHQQMVYAVAMTTIEHFERALGRPVLWRARIQEDNPYDDGDYVPRLVINPHALHQANAYYSPRQVSLLFGFFEAAQGEMAQQSLPGSRVYTCLSYDIIVHETTHAILDSLYRRFNEPTNPDVLAFHEGFADLVALFQHFTMPQLLEREIARTRGDLEADSILGKMALQFGDALYGRGALRDAIGRIDQGSWTRAEPDPSELQRRRAPHARGAILVGAVFDAFLTIYRTRTADLLRLASGGTGRLPEGAIHPDLVKRLAKEAAKTSSHLLNICIRALDYLPPVDPTFFEFLRAMITADYELVKDDRYGYRVALVEAFRRRGIYPLNLEAGDPESLLSLSVDTLLWKGPDVSKLSAVDPKKVGPHLRTVVRRLKRYAEISLYLRDRETLFERTRWYREKLHEDLEKAFANEPSLARCFYLDEDGPSFEVHELRRAMRLGPDGEARPQVIVALTQSEPMSGEGLERFVFRGGSTLVMDLRDNEIRYCIHKDFKSTTRRRRQETYLRDASADPLRALVVSHDSQEPFAALHGLAEAAGEDGIGEGSR